MNRRSFSQLAMTAPLTFTPGFRMLKSILDLNEYTMKPLRGSVGYFTERGGTIVWMIEEGSIVVVDTQFPDQAANLKAAIQEQSQGSIEYVINTHHHGDHTGGNIAFQGIAKNIVAHTNSKINQRNSAESRGNLDKILLPDVTFDDVWRQEVGSEIITATYWGAGHTNGDAIIHFENANVVHIGDLVFNRRYPYIDKGAGASIENWIEILDKSRKHFDNDTIFVCGHSDNGYGIVVDKDDIKAFTNYLEKVLDFVSEEINAGKSDDEILKATAIPGAPEWQGNGIQRSLSAAIEELRK